MAALNGKPGQRCSVAEWESSNRLMSNTAAQSRLASQRIRQEGRALRDETANKTQWDKSDSSRRLSERIQEVSNWKDRLESCAQDVAQEIKVLTKIKEETERALSATAVPLEVSTECLTIRERRRGRELLIDPVEAELRKEVEAIGRAQRSLQQRTSKAFQQLCLLQEARQQVISDLNSKTEALDVDRTCLSLTVTSADISLKPDPLRVPPGSTTPQQWEQFSRYNVSRAEEEMLASLNLREDIILTIAQVQNELQAQYIATNFALRKQAHHLQQAYDELLWQQKTTKEEITELERDICGLEEDLRAKDAPLKLVHTRLENRTMRPGADLCQDQVQYGLLDEAKQLDGSATSLKQKLSEAQHSLQILKQHEACMEEDLSCKLDALSLEQQSLETRKHLANVSRDQLDPGTVTSLTKSTRDGKLQP
ncbi:tektin-2 isoform X1 [Brienomyrus brachyistius]|uniref:tektin-2 isoform X1 n=1 Tax=Brienomyrus brachyistius TaxID=42636 RepID=UPI0020B3E677|nr:tektin-2 isoform X1 [Brienomyrus brachyistius]XP_048848754.1 tektin-2 isoform X1 [Brienomyrus brachyistius]XP_048848755.1 tektin-2 isoform X1 [Brienomyrus brachyistius]